jgi:hypothetical protein
MKMKTPLSPASQHPSLRHFEQTVFPCGASCVLCAECSTEVFAWLVCHDCEGFARCKRGALVRSS